MESKKSITPGEAKKTFLKKGTCAQAFFYILNERFGRRYEKEEIAADYLAGGILRQGYQCGMLWGATLASGAEAFHREKTPEGAKALAIQASVEIVKSFKDRTKTVECSDITETDMSSNLNVVKYMFSGKFLTCFRLAGDWAGEAIEVAGGALEKQNNEGCTSCASEVVKKMGGSDDHAVMVAGFAGGVGLSGNGCGALAAAIWLACIGYLEESGKRALPMRLEKTEAILKKFQEKTQYELLCSQITRREFKTPQDHSDFIKNGGCAEIIEMLAAP